MKNLNRKYLLLTIIMFTLAVACGYIVVFIDQSMRYFIGLAIGIISLTLIKSKEPLIG